MKTFLRFWVFSDDIGKLSAKNIPIAIIISLVLFVLVSGLGHIFFDLWGITIESELELSPLKLLMSKTLFGAILLGLVDGFLFLIGLIGLALKVPK